MAEHISVLLAETLSLLAPKPGDTVLDCTLGLGGHSEALLKKVLPGGALIGLDADRKNLALATKRLEPYVDAVTLIHANFREIPACLPTDRMKFDVILADLGLSSPHIDSPERGFTFRSDSDLDMRFDQTSGMTAAMFIASVDRITLRDIFNKYGEIPSAHRLTDALIERRTSNPVRRSGDLVDVAKSVYAYKANDYLPQIFQALRIAVNDEVGALEHFLREAPLILKPGGRLAVISYHSLEDRLTKHMMKSLSTAEKDVITGSVSRDADFEILTPKPVTPSDEELQKNPRSRSARLRAIRASLLYTPRP